MLSWCRSWGGDEMLTRWKAADRPRNVDCVLPSLGNAPAERRLAMLPLGPMYAGVICFWMCSIGKPQPRVPVSEAVHYRSIHHSDS